MTSTVGTVGTIRQRATLLELWRLSPDPAVRVAIEVELYGEPDRERATQESARLAGLAR